MEEAPLQKKYTILRFTQVLDKFRSIQLNPIALRDPLPPINAITLDKMNDIWTNLLKSLLTKEYFLEYEIDKEHSITNFDRMIPRLPNSRISHFVNNLTISPFNFKNIDCNSVGFLLIGDVQAGSKCYNFISVLQITSNDNVLRKRILFDESFDFNIYGHDLLPSFIKDLLSVDDDVDRKHSVGIFSDNEDREPNPLQTLKLENEVES
ncbi:MAG: hypothetical protein ABIM99_02015 [Candidatus Dojkabacteria bacterium]